VDRQIELTEYLANRIEELPDFEKVSPVETAVCCFRFAPNSRDVTDQELDTLQGRLQQVIERSGEAWLTTTVLHGQRVMRVNVNSFLTEKRHIDDLVELLERAGRSLQR
jgi:aromatic-L-amino-acid decarboxylase